MMDGMKIARERLLYSFVEDEGDRMNIVPEYYYVSACSCMPVVRWNHVKVSKIVFEGLLVGLRSKTTLRRYIEHMSFTISFFVGSRA